jgi:hypothetical protein
MAAGPQSGGRRECTQAPTFRRLCQLTGMPLDAVAESITATGNLVIKNPIRMIVMH